MTLPIELGNAAFLYVVIILLIGLAIVIYKKPIQRPVSKYPPLSPADFRGNELLKEGNAVVFLYAGWCPFCRRSYAFLRLLKPDSGYVVYRADISDRGNTLWESMKISTVPTLIAFRDHKEWWRRNGLPGVGLTEEDFRNVHNAMSNHEQRTNTANQPEGMSSKKGRPMGQTAHT